MKLYPVFAGDFQVCIEISGPSVVRGQNALQQPRQSGFAEIFALPLALGVKIVVGGAGRLPLYLFRHFIEQAVREADCSFRKRHIKLVLLCEKTELLGLDRIRRINPDAAVAVEDSPEDDSVD